MKARLALIPVLLLLVVFAILFFYDEQRLEADRNTVEEQQHVDAGRSRVENLLPNTFDKVVMNPEKHVFVMFYAYWCPHCNRMKPKWDELAQQLADNPDVVIAQIDTSVYKKVGRTHGVHSFPTLRMFPKNNKGGVPYHGPRDVTAIKSFVKMHMV